MGSGGGWKTAPLEGEGTGQCSWTLRWCRVEDARELENGTKKGRCAFWDGRQQWWMGLELCREEQFAGGGGGEQWPYKVVSLDGEVRG